MKLGFKKTAILLVFGVLLLSSAFVLAEEKVTTQEDSKVTTQDDPSDFISDIETTGVTGSNNSIILTDDDIDENVEKLIETIDDDQESQDTEQDN